MDSKSPINLLNNSPNVFYRARFRNIRWWRGLQTDREAIVNPTPTEVNNLIIADEEPGDGINEGLPVGEGVSEERVIPEPETTGQEPPSHILNRYSQPIEEPEPHD